MSPGLAAKALVDAEGDQNKAVAFYIKYRVQQLKEQLAAEIKEQAVRQKWEKEEGLKQAEVDRKRKLEEFNKSNPAVLGDLKGIWKWLNDSW